MILESETVCPFMRNCVTPSDDAPIPSTIPSLKEYNEGFVAEPSIFTEYVPGSA
jgi:hypothetical protein